MFIVPIIAGVIATALTSVGVGAVAATAIGYVVTGAAVAFGGAALSKALAPKIKTGVEGLSQDSTNYSTNIATPTYGSINKITQTNNKLPIPIMYGELKLAGNRLWQGDNDTGNIRRIVAFAGEVSEYNNIKLNDIDYNTISGCIANRYYGSNSNNLIDTMVDGNTNAERAEKVGSLRHVAYLAINTPQNDNIRGDYNLTSIVKGKKVKIFIDENTYTMQYSNNTAWCLLDFLSCYEGGRLGCDENGNFDLTILKNNIDINSFITSANFCGTNNFTFNMIFDGKVSINDAIEQFKLNCSGNLIQKNNKLYFKVDKVENPVMTINKEDIVYCSEQVFTLPNEEKYDVLNIKYISTAYEYTEVVARAEDTTSTNNPLIEHNVSILSITNHTHASKLAWFYLNRNKLCYFHGTFSSDYRVQELEVGDVIYLNDIVMNFENLLVKVVSISDNNDGTFTVNWLQYNASLYNYQLGSVEPIIIHTPLTNIYTKLNSVTNFNVVQNLNTINFSWTPVTKIGNADVQYIIKEGDTFNTANIITTTTNNNYYTSTDIKTGITKYWIVATNGYSVSDEVYDILSVQNIPNANYLTSYNILSDGFCTSFLWEKINTWDTINSYYISNSNWAEPITQSILNSGVLSLIPTATWENLDVWKNTNSYYTNPNNEWDTQTELIGYFTSKVYALSTPQSVQLRFAGGDLTSFDGSGSYEILYRLRETSSSDFTSWKKAITGIYNYQEIQFMVVLKSNNGYGVTLENVVITADVPDRIENYTNRQITNATNGISIVYSTDVESKIKSNYNINEPCVIATSKSNTTYPVVTSSTNSGCTIKLYDNNGTLTTGNLNIQIFGY